jgi:hypothetical protein
MTTKIVKMDKTIILSVYIMVFKKIGNWFNKNLGLSKLLESKIVLYILVTIGILNIYTYAMEDEFAYAGILLIVGFLSTFFNKNMIVIIFTAIAITNLIRFGMEEYKNQEGFTNGLGSLDDLMNHMTKDEKLPTASSEEEKKTEVPKEEVPNEEVPKEQESPNNGETGIDFEYDKDAQLNQDPTKRDSEIDRFIKQLNPSGILQKMEVSVDKKQVSLAKDKIELALKYTDKIANEEQRHGIESLLKLQLKMLQQLLTISPLVEEFREVVKMLNV